MGAGCTIFRCSFPLELARICRLSGKNFAGFSGNISYPLYMTHYAAIWIFENYFTNKNPSATELTYIIIGGIIFLVAIAYLVMRFYDIPLKRYLTEKRRQRLKGE
jgi:peptidoglycan/LPS O-acetylase OafA/YrhL